jgi:hypothetical protein
VSVFRLAKDRLNGIRDVIDEVARDHAGWSESPGRQVACCTM